jgi:muramoyltetrapeptide carboxypeptidase
MIGRREFAVATAGFATPGFAEVKMNRPSIKPPRLARGDTVALINPSNAVYPRLPYVVAAESLAAMGFRVREAPNLRARYGPFAGTDAMRAADVNAMFADDTVKGILALTGGSGGTRILPLLDYELIARHPKVLAGFSDITALLNAVHARTGLITFHGPVADSEWNGFSVSHFLGAVMEGRALELRNPPDTSDLLVPRAGRVTTVRGGKASGPLVGGNLAVLTAMAGSRYWPSFDGAVLFLEEVNEYLYRVDRMLSTLKLAGALDRLAAVVLGAFTNCTPGEGSYGALTLDEIFDDYFKPLNVPVFAGASFGHIRRKLTLPVGLPVEIDADAGTIRFLSSAVS